VGLRSGDGNRALPSVPLRERRTANDAVCHRRALYQRQGQGVRRSLPKAIFAEDETPEPWKHFIELNKQFFVDHPGVQPCTTKN
jgi:hypothetical protein